MKGDIIRARTGDKINLNFTGEYETSIELQYTNYFTEDSGNDGFNGYTVTNEEHGLSTPRVETQNNTIYRGVADGEPVERLSLLKVDDGTDFVSPPNNNIIEVQIIENEPTIAQHVLTGGGMASGILIPVVVALINKYASDELKEKIKNIAVITSKGIKGLLSKFKRKEK